LNYTDSTNYENTAIWEYKINEEVYEHEIYPVLVNFASKYSVWIRNWTLEGMYDFVIAKKLKPEISTFELLYVYFNLFGKVKGDMKDKTRLDIWKEIKSGIANKYYRNYRG
jgi:hypothetical protein